MDPAPSPAASTPFPLPDPSRTAAELASAVEEAAAVLSAATDVTLVAHVQPDADALGSALALGITLHRRGATVRVAFAEPDTMPVAIAPLDVHGLVVPASAVPEAPELFVSCDSAEPSRIGSLASRLDTARTSIMIDHHVSNPGFGDVRVLDPSAEATVVLVHRILVAMGERITPEVARCLYAGLATDTVGFRTAGPAAHRLAAELIEHGVEPEELMRPLLDTHPFAWLGALGDALHRAVHDPAAARGHGLVHTVLDRAVVDAFGPEEVDGVVTLLGSAAEAEVAAVIKEVGDRRYRGSLRSSGRVDVAAAAARLGGGGHRKAAGFTHEGTAEEVLADLRAALDG